jgi:hypothetical protein
MKSKLLVLVACTTLTACGADRGHGKQLGDEDMAASQFDFSGGDLADVEPEGDGGNLVPADPTTCADAMTTKSYIGCDYWPTVTGNAVWSVFDFAVVISNPGANTANITVTGGALTATVTQTVAPGTLVKIGLPWVPALKGADADAAGNPTPMVNSVKAAAGAYHLVSDVPVLVYQFNALQYQSGTSGNDLHGVAWSTCPGDPCLSYSNDASLLLPTTAMTPNYVVTGIPGSSTTGAHPTAINSSYMTITGTAAGTTVKMQLSKTADILASSDGTTIPATAQNATTPATVTYTISAGDVLELIDASGATNDFTGSIVEASAPIQVIVGNPCTSNPASGMNTCDHIEETVLPIETWGKQYLVTAPTGPEANLVQHTVRIYGGAMASNLTVTPAITGAPTSIAAGAVVTFSATKDFFISGDQPFAVSSEQLSAEVVDPLGLFNPLGPSGDPSLSFFSAVEQFRLKYLFLAPTDYATNYVVVALPTGATVMLDGAPATGTATAVGQGYSVLRITLSAGTAGGAHTLTSTQPFGIQIMGYGAQTSYQYPGGLDLKVISAPPPPIQ